MLQKNDDRSFQAVSSDGRLLLGTRAPAALVSLLPYLHLYFHGEIWRKQQGEILNGSTSSRETFHQQKMEYKEILRESDR